MENRGTPCGQNTEILMFSLVVIVVNIELYIIFISKHDYGGLLLDLNIMAVCYLLDLNAIGL
jgi:hypothetical protein